MDRRVKLKALTRFRGVKENKTFPKGHEFDTDMDRAVEMAAVRYKGKPVVEPLVSKANTHSGTAVYISGMNKIGGVETFAINLCNRMGFDLIYDSANIGQLSKLKHNFFKQGYTNHNYKNIILATAWGNPMKNIRANRVVQIVHADYEAYIDGWNFIYNKRPETTHHVCVGKHVGRQFEKVTGFKCDKVIYNLLSDGPRPKKTHPKKLTFVTVSRISREKGFDRMLKLAEAMKHSDHEWRIYGDASSAYAKGIIDKLARYPKVKFMGVTREPLEVMAGASYLVQLSDTEGFPYSIYESLSVRTPVIVTNFPSAHELVKHGKNGYIMDMNMEDLPDFGNVPMIKSFREKSTERDWVKFLGI